MAGPSVQEEGPKHLRPHLMLRRTPRAPTFQIMAIEDLSPKASTISKDLGGLKQGKCMVGTRLIPVEVGYEI
jgi:hypothetical protein